MCCYSAELNRQVNELTLEEIEKITDYLPNLETLQVSGGEPFLRKDLYEVLEIFSRKCPHLKQIGIPTNGILQDVILSQCKKISRLYPELSITVSIDGYKELHNEIRGVDCWDKAIETFKKLKMAGIKTSVNISLSKLTYDSYINSIKFINTLGPDDICIGLVRGKPDLMLSAEEFKKIRPEIERLILWHRTPFYEKRQKLLNDAYYQVLSGKKLPYRCWAGKIIAVLEPDGGVRSCEMRKVLGNVRDYDYNIKEILKLDNIPKDCSCIHGCFVGPSMSYSLPWILRNLFCRRK